MIDIGKNYHTILWPSAYVTSALERAPELATKHPGLSKVYQTIFSEDRIRVGSEPPSLPFNKSLPEGEGLTLLSEHSIDLPLSIVTVTRNDEHVERMQDRTQAFIDCIYHLASKYKKKVELIIVEWNPPSNKPPLKEEFQYYKNHPYVSVVIITVPHSVHSNYKLAKDLPLYQMIGKNVGIRRARGSFILATNIDILFSDELFKFITSETRQGCIYRSNRWDINREILDLRDSETMLAESKSYCFQINYPNGILPKNHTPRFEVSFGERVTGLEHLHTWACGDFQLLHRDDWARLRGYSELDAYSLHLDSLFALTCLYANLKEVNLGNNAPHYHIDHTLGKPVKADTYIINEKKALFHISYLTLLCCGLEMKKNKDYYIFNEDNWGLSGYKLNVVVVCRADWEQRPPTYIQVTKNKYPASRCPASDFATDNNAIANVSNWLATAIEVVTDYLQSQHGKRPLWIWGAGERGRLMCNLLQQTGLIIQGFIHNTELPTATTTESLPVLRFKDLIEPKQKFFLISSVFADEIRAELEHSGCEEGNDYIVLI